MRTKTSIAAKQTIFDLIEGYYIAHLLIHLTEKKALNQQSRRLSAREKAIWQILYDKTDLVIRKGGGYSLNPAYGSYLDLQFHIDKFLKAYGTFDLKGTTPRIQTDSLAFSRAFDKAHALHRWDQIISIIEALGATTILDLGSGPGRLPEQFCEGDIKHRAVGIDANRHLVRAARDRTKRLGRRCRFVQGDVLAFDRLLTPQQVKTIDVVIGSNIFNEFFEDGRQLVMLLKKLVSVFKGKHLLILDYYGVLHSSRAGNRQLQHSYLHDIVQLFSGQGVPPPDRSGWNKYYRQAGCRLLQAREGTHNGVGWFIHILQL